MNILNNSRLLKALAIALGSASLLVACAKPASHQSAFTPSAPVLPSQSPPALDDTQLPLTDASISLIVSHLDQPSSMADATGAVELLRRIGTSTALQAISEDVKFRDGLCVEDIPVSPPTFLRPSPESERMCIGYDGKMLDNSRIVNLGSTAAAEIDPADRRGLQLYMMLSHDDEARNSAAYLEAQALRKQVAQMRVDIEKLRREVRRLSPDRSASPPL